MPIYRPTPLVPNRHGAIMHVFATPSASASQPASTLQPDTTPQPATQIANQPNAPGLTQGSGSDLLVAWIAPTVDSTHDAATGYNLRFGASGTGNWTTVTGTSSPYDLSGLAAGAAIDVQLQGVNAAGTSGWSAASTLTTASAAPNPPSAPSLAQGSGSDLTVTWSAPAVDSTHNAATGFNLRSGPSGTGNWTTVTSVTSPYRLSGLAAGAAIDVQVQGANTAGSGVWSAGSTLTTASAGPYAPNTPAITTVAATPDGTTSKLIVTWAAPAVDSTHGAATGFNLRYGPAGAGTWTMVSGVTSPYAITGLAGATAIDVEVQAIGAAVNPSAWSAPTTGTTWGATIVPGSWTPAASQVHGAGVAPNGGVNAIVVAAPTTVTGAAFAWAASASTVPATGLIAGGGTNQPNLWGQWFNVPATAGTYYLWTIAQGANNTTIGAFVSLHRKKIDAPAITVT